jgi:hypothetical protein
MDMIVKGFNMLFGGVVGGSALNSTTGRSNFENVSTYDIIIAIIVLLVVIGVSVALLVGVYRLTGNSWLHVILCVLLGGVYLAGAVIYYGLSGYKFCKVK